MSSTETANAVGRVSNRMLGARKATLLVRATLHLYRVLEFVRLLCIFVKL